MEEFKIYLGETGPNHDKKLRLIFGSFGLIYLVFGAIAYFTPLKSSIFMFIIGGLFLILYAIGYKRVVRRCHITLNENGISSLILQKWGTFPKYEKLDITWEKIKSINIRSLKIEMNLNDGTSREIELGDLLYHQHQTFKGKLQEFIEWKNISIHS